MNQILVEAKHLQVLFPAKKEAFFARRRYVHAVNDVSLTIYKGETFGLVGESGCGKSTFANATLGFVRPSKGEILFDGEPLDPANRARYQNQRARMQKIFQDPGSSLNPRFTVEDVIREPLRIRKGFIYEEEERLTEEMMERVGLSPGDRLRNTTEFSGGQQQRIAIARALILKPDYLVCDEPVSALDVSVHAQILNLLMDLQEELGVTYLFISHNLAVVKKLCRQMAVMYMGEIVESGDADEIFRHPAHPYTQALMAAVLPPDSEGIPKNALLKGDIASPLDPPKGCRFAGRCPKAADACKTGTMTLRKIAEGHYTACPFAE